MSGKKGAAGHFLAQRLSAAALAVLAVLFVIAAALSLPDLGYGSVVAFLSQPFNAVIVALLAVVALYHMALGMDEVIADYISKPETKSALSLLNKLGPLVLGVAALYAIWRINFGA